MQPIDAWLIKKIDELVKDGVKNINEMKLSTLKMFSGVELPLKTNGWYYPGKKTIKNHMIESTKKFRHSKTGQECLVQKIIDWKKEESFDNLFF